MFHDACTSPVPTSTYATLSFENETNRRQQCLHRQASKACGTRYPGKNQFSENSAVHVFHPGVHFCAGIKISLGGFVMRKLFLTKGLFLTLLVFLVPAASRAQLSVGVSVRFGPPAIPI